VPTFCRHNRLVQNCPICSRQEVSRSASRGAQVRRSSSAKSSARRATRPARTGDLRVRRVERAPDDGYANGLVPGLRATADAARLADEIAFAAARLEELSTDPRGLYVEVASDGDLEEASWLAFLIAFLSPVEGDDPFAGVRSARTPWATGELPDLEGVPLGPRTSLDPARGHATLTAYRAWAERAGSQAAAVRGEASWTPQRRFDRVYERLALPGLRRAARFEFLLLLGRLELYDLEPWSLKLDDASDPTTLAAKRVFGIGDQMNLHRRASDLAGEAGVPIAALDLALVNWSRRPEERITAGSTAEPDASVRVALGAALGA